MVNFLVVYFSKKAHVHQKNYRPVIFSLYFQKYLKSYLVDNF